MVLLAAKRRANLHARLAWQTEQAAFTLLATHDTLLLRKSHECTYLQ